MRRQAGVSVIETMIVVALIAILVMLALPVASEWLANSRIRTAAESMLAGLQLARAEAVRRNGSVVFAVTGGAGWTIQAADGSVVQQRPAGEGTADVTVTVTPNGATQVSFDGLGRRAANADGSASAMQFDIDLPTSVLAASKTRDLRMLVGLGGQITMCDPNVTATDDVRRCP